MVDDARQLVVSPSKDKIHELLLTCLEDGGLQALQAVGILFEEPWEVDWVGISNEAVAFSLLYWGEPGLQTLIERVVSSPTVKNRLRAIRLLCHLSSGQAPEHYYCLQDIDSRVTETVLRRVSQHQGLADFARKTLREYLLNLQDDSDVTLLAGAVMSMAAIIGGTKGALEFFLALAGRWIAVGQAVLSEFEALISKNSDDEPAFQRFFTRNPQLLDPMAMQVWPQPDLHGALVPDFIIRRTDDSYLVVEIETPIKTLVTAQNQICAEVTHAVGQAVDYRSFLMERAIEVRQHLPGFRNTECLVVVGLEKGLSRNQARTLFLENEARNGLRIVGFDWILERGRAIARNVVERPYAVETLRLV